MWLLPVVALVISCGGEDDADSYFPVAVGNTWTYDIMATVLTPGDTLTNAGTSTTEITRLTTLDNDVEAYEEVTVMMWNDSTMIPNSVDTTYIQVTDDHILIYDDLADTDPDTVAVLPIEAGNTWTVYADAADTMTAEVIEQTDVTVPAGTFADSWLIRYTSLGQTQENYLGRNVGIVKYDMWIAEQNADIEFIKELTDYDVE